MNDIGLGGVRKAGRRRALASAAQGFYNAFNKSRQNRLQGERNQYAQNILTALNQGNLDEAQKMMASEEFNRIAQNNPQLANQVQQQYGATRDRLRTKAIEDERLAMERQEFNLNKTLTEIQIEAAEEKARQAGYGWKADKLDQVYSTIYDTNLNKLEIAKSRGDTEEVQRLIDRIEALEKEHANQVRSLAKNPEGYKIPFPKEVDYESLAVERLNLDPTNTRFEAQTPSLGAGIRIKRAPSRQLGQYKRKDGLPDIGLNIGG
jgi:tape measure domain-containing protein